MAKSSDSLLGYAREIHKRDKYVCQYCGFDGKESLSHWLNLSVDHLLPKDHLEKDNPEFQATACRSCNEMDNHFLEQAAKRGLKFDNMTRQQLIDQRRSYVVGAREKYKKYWEKNIAIK